MNLVETNYSTQEGTMTMTIKFHSSNGDSLTVFHNGCEYLYTKGDSHCYVVENGEINGRFKASGLYDIKKYIGYWNN